MFVIPLAKSQVETLDQGESIPVRINGRAASLARDGDYLCYRHDGDPLNRCRILLVTDWTDDAVLFHCGSNGQDDAVIQAGVEIGGKFVKGGAG